MKELTHWISCRVFTIEVVTRDGVIVKAAPLARKFVGQRLANLLDWAGEFGGLEHHMLEGKKKERLAI